MLKEHMQKKGLLRMRELDLEALQSRYDSIQEQYNCTKDEEIEGQQLHGITYSDMPHSTELSNPTEKTALKTMDKKEEITSCDYAEIERIQNMKYNLEREIAELKIEVERVEICLSVLKRKEKFVICMRYFDGLTVEETMHKFYDVFGYGSTRNIHQQVGDALYKMRKVLRGKS